ncbi:MAG: hypothetical protein K0R72_965 [Clostridia bacterium]|jgi:hypothetical protein|nr:hypothetical protein [Clostridia bacterium]
MARKEECETCHWNIKTALDGSIKCYKDHEWRKRKRCRRMSY